MCVCPRWFWLHREDAWMASLLFLNICVYDFSQHTSALGHEHTMQVSLNQRWGSAPPCKVPRMKTSAKTMHAKTSKPEDYKISKAEPASALLLHVLLLYEHAMTISIIVITTTGFHPKQTHGTTDARFDQAAKFRWRAVWFSRKRRNSDRQAAGRRDPVRLADR